MPGIYQPISVINANPNSGDPTPNSSAAIDLGLGATAVGVEVAGTYTGALTPQGSDDGINWFALGPTSVTNQNTGAQSGTIASAATGIFIIAAVGIAHLRLTALAAMTGQANVGLAESDAAPGVGGSAGSGAATNVDGIALASAARTASTFSASIQNLGAFALLVFLDVTAMPGSPAGLQLRVLMVDPVTGHKVQLNADPTAVVATGQTLYVVTSLAGGGAVNAAAQTTQCPIPRTFQIEVVHGDGKSYTYSVGYSLVQIGQAA